RLASGSGDKTVKVWDAANGQQILTLQGSFGWVHSVAFSPDGKRIVGGSGEFYEPGAVKVWDAASGQEILTLKGHDLSTSMAFRLDGKRLASASGDGTAKVWDANNGQEILTLKEHAGRIWSVAFSPNGKRLASGGQDMLIRIWDVSTG